MPQYNGVWTLDAAAQAQSNQQWVTDPNFKNTTLLLQADNAANAAQNNTFLDSSPNSFAITRKGNTTQGSFTPFSQSPGWWSNYCGTAGTDYLSAGSQAAYAFGNGIYTIEFWVYPTAAGGSDSVFLSIETATTGWYVSRNANTGIALVIRGGANVVSTTTGQTPLNQWTHVVITRASTASNQTRIFANGVLVAVGTDANNWTGTGNLVFMNTGVAGYNAAGYLSNVRLIKGSIPTEYQTSSTTIGANIFNPSTVGLTTTSQGATAANVSLLTCQSYRFVDNSNNGFTITPFAAASVQPFSPFAPQYQWTPTVIGGSGYFDGTGDYLTVANTTALQFGTGDYTVQFWVYLTSFAGTPVLIDFRTANAATGGAIQIYSTTAGIITVYGGSSTATLLITAGSAITLNSWNHIVVTRSGTGANTRLFINGVQSGSTASDATSYGLGSPWIFSTASGGNYPSGYLSGLQVLKGTGYTSFPIPTAPPTAITNTQLLLNFTNAGIYDGTMKNNLETVGNAQISTSVVKYGSGSMYFDGTGDYLSLPVQKPIELGGADWTFETWVYMNVVSTQQSIIYLNGNATGYAALNLQVQSGALNLWLSSTGAAWSLQQNTISTISTNTWTHIAVVKVGTNIKLYINGVNVSGAGYTVAASLMTTYTLNQIGTYNTSSYNLNGYLDDMRLTLGVARYFQNFIPPKVALPRQ